MLAREMQKDFQAALKAQWDAQSRSGIVPHLAIRKPMPGKDLHRVIAGK